MIYYRRYVGDFQRDTGHLSLIEVGAYDRLLDHYYATEEALPDSLDDLYRISRAVSDGEKEAVRRILSLFFPPSQGRRRHNLRADKEIKIALSARENGGKGGRPKKTGWQTGDETGAGTGNETGGVTETITGEGGGSGQPPTTNHQPFSSTTTNHQPAGVAAAPHSEHQVATQRGAMAKALRDEGVTNVTPSNPYVVAWVEAGVTIQTVRQAVDLAREQKPKPQAIPVKYLAPIIEREHAQAGVKVTMSGNGTRDTTCCELIEGRRCGQPGVFADAMGRKWKCREHEA